MVYVFSLDIFFSMRNIGNIEIKFQAWWTERNIHLPKETES